MWICNTKEYCWSVRVLLKKSKSLSKERVLKLSHFYSTNTGFICKWNKCTNLTSQDPLEQTANLWWIKCSLFLNAQINNWYNSHGTAFTKSIGIPTENPCFHRVGQWYCPWVCGRILIFSVAWPGDGSDSFCRNKKAPKIHRTAFRRQGKTCRIQREYS